MLPSDRGSKKRQKKINRAKRARQAREQYTKGGSKRDANIIKSVKKVFTPTEKPQQSKKVAGTSYNTKESNRVGGGQYQGTRKAVDQLTGTHTRPERVGYSGGGQFQGIKSAVDQWRDSYRPQNISEYAQAAAKADTTRDADVYNFYNKNRLSQQYHDEVIAVGQGWMTDQKKYTNWILSAPTPEEQNARVQQAEEYLNNAMHEVPVYDEASGAGGTQMQFKADAELPPWIEPTSYNADIWEYYTIYSHDVVQASADAYREARDKGREYSKNPYKSAFAGAEQTGQVDSFLDVAIKAMDPSTVNEDLLGNYFRDYVINPIKAGELKTAAGNTLWNFMDTMDVASRGVRAFTAGKPELGSYSGNNGNGQVFEGQDSYWVTLDGQNDEISKLAQTIFLENGGRELLRLNNSDRTAGVSGADPEKLKAQIKAAFDSRPSSFADKGVTWEQVYDAIQSQYYRGEVAANRFERGLENVKKAYTDVDANFNASTGHMASDIIVETVLDPGTFVGGISKNMAKFGVESAAETAVKRGLNSIALDDDTARTIMNNKQVQGAFRQLINSNEGRNIIFRSTKDFENDIDTFILKLREAKVFSKDETAKVFKDTVTSELMGKNVSVNGAVIASQDFARKTLDSKAFKSMYYLDKAIDGVDSAIIKSSFFLPWAGLKGSKALYDNAVNLAANSELIQKAAKRLGLRKQNALRVLIDEKTGSVNVTKVGDLMDQFESGLHHEKDVRTALQAAVDQYDDIAWNINDVIRKFSAGEINDEEALRLVGEFIHDSTGGQYRYVQELAGYVDNLAHRYSGDIRSAYGRINDTFSRLQNLIDRRSENAVDGFIDKVRQAQNSDELMRLFRENMDNPYIMELRERIIDNAQFDITAGELDELVNAVRTGRFSDTSIDTETIKKGIKAQSKASDKTLRRTVSFDTFDNILQSMGVNWKKVVADLEVPDNNVGIFEKKISEFMKGWSGQKYVTYNTDDMLKFVDRFQRQIQFKELMNVGTPSEVSALSAHQMVGEFNKLRKHLKRLDLVNLKDVKVITLPQMDRMAMNLEFRNNSDIQNMYGGFYDDVIAPLWNQFRNMASDEVDLVDSSLFKDIDAIARQKYGFDRTSQLIEEAKTLPGFSDEHLHSFLNTLATDFRFRDDLGNIDLSPGMLRRRIEANLRAQTGESKVGRKNMVDALQSIDSDNPSAFLKPYWDEVLSKPALKRRLETYIQKDVLDPTSYVETQMIFTALADPSVIPEWNALAAKGQAPIAMHINSTGLNTEINSMTSISFRKWVPIEVSEENPLTLERLLDAMDEGETTVFQRYMRDDEFGEYTEQVIRRLDIKDANVDNIMDRLKGIYGIPEGGNYKSEDQMIEEVCAYLSDATIFKDDGLRSVAPTLLVHDLDGFNVNYLNNKISAKANALDPKSKTYDYLTRISKSARDNSCNTYTRLAEQVGDLYYTDEQLELITNMLHDYVDDINHFAQGYRFNDMQSYSRRMHKMIDELKLKEDANELTEKEKQFLDMFRSSNGDEALGAYDNAVRNITDLGLYPRQYAFLSSDIDENLTKTAMDATGRTAVNTGSRIYVDDVLSYFNLETEDGFYAPIEDLRKMNEVSQYIIRTRNRQIVAGAEEFLLPHKADFDRVIQSVIDLARGNSYEATKLSYLQNMKIPDNAIDSYLMAKKLYADHLKYWLDTDSLTSLRTEGKDLDAMKQELRSRGKELGFDDPLYELEQHRVFQSACDYINDNRTRFFDELVGGGFDIDNLDNVRKYAEESKAISDSIPAVWTELREANAVAKEEMLALNKAEWAEKYKPFKEFLDSYYEPMLKDIDEQYKVFMAEKKAKWDYFFNVVKPERERLTDLRDDYAAVGLWSDPGYLHAEEELKRLNQRWAEYNEAYMRKWFHGLDRNRVREPYRFKTAELTKQYDELIRQAESNRALAELKGDRAENYLIAAQVAEKSAKELAEKEALNRFTRHSWIQWEGTPKLDTRKKELLEELNAAKHGQLNLEDSIIAAEYPEFSEAYQRFVDSGSTLDAVRASTQERYLDYRELLDLNYEEALYNSEIQFADAQLLYEEFDLTHLGDLDNATYNFQTKVIGASDETLDLLQGAHEPEIYNWASRSDFEKRVLNYKDNVMRSGLDKAAHYMEVSSQIKSDMRQLQHMDEYFAAAGIIRSQDRFTASVYSKSKLLFDILEENNFLKRDSFHDFLQKASRTHRLHLQQYRLNSLRNADGVFDRTKLLSDLVYNGFNMSVFNAYNYTPKEMDELLGFVKDLQKGGDDFLSYYEDRTTGNIFIYLNDKCTVAEGSGSRWINNNIKLDRSVRDFVAFPEFDELKEILDIDDIEDFRGVYAHLKSCWEDTRVLSMGQINGTTGKTISRRQADEFIQSLPLGMSDWATSNGLLQDELTRGVIYDPGFVVNEESDMLTDFLGTLQRQAETAKDDAILINEVFHSTGSVQFSELAQNFSTEELVEYFGENPEYVVCTIVGDSKTASGFKVQQLNLNNALGVENARNMQNTTILPYSTYYEISNYMNRDVSDNVYKKLLGKYMLVYKAFALVKPGTWMRNFIDATSKAAFDNREGLGGLISMAQYEAKAARDIGTYGRIIAADPKLLNPANWDVIQSTFNTDMTFEDFELLRGLMDSNRYKSADKYFLSRTAKLNNGFNVISGDNIGLRNLDEDSIKEAVRKYLSAEPDLPLKDSEFLELYMRKQAGETITDDVLNQQFEGMFSRLSNNLRSSNAGNVFDKTIDTMFKPFGQVEELVRYAQTLQLRDNGFSQNQITRHIHNTQFYNAPTWGKWRQLETIMPFITFKYNNMMYWVRMMDENPRLYRYFADTYRSVYETTLESALEEGVELDYENDYGLQSGGIPIGNGKAYFNMGSSFLSAMNDFYGIPHDIDSLNPLLRDTVRTSMYVLGLNSKQFFKDLDLELTDAEVVEHSKELLPGYKLFRDSIKTFKDIAGTSTASGGPSMDALYKTMKLFGIMGVRWQYRDKTGRFSFEEYQEDLAAQGKWYDVNLGKVVDLSEKNEYGANDPNNSFADTQAYMMTHFGKIWDANQNKFVTMDQYQEGGLNEGFDFDNDPEAWSKLCQVMWARGKRWDNNQRKFVYFEDYISGGLNAPNLDWDSKVALMEEKFPNLIWDANQQAFVEKRFYIRGGMNEFSQYSGDEFLSHWNELKSMRLALYGETYNKELHQFEKTAEPSIVLWDQFMGLDEREKYDNYYAQLGIPRLMSPDKPLHVTDEGLLVNSEGQYILTGDAKYDARVFDKFRHTYSYGGRSYDGHKNYSYNKTRRSSKPYKGRTLAPTYYQPQNYTNGYRFREEFEYNYQYTSPNPGAKLNYLISPPRHYPYGGGYNKFSFINKY